MSVPGAPPAPDLRNCDKGTLAVAKYLRNNEIIKQRPALMGGQRWDMFKVKRAVRALLDPAYEKARKSNQRLPEIKDRLSALQILAQLPAQRFAYNVTKLETEDAIAKGMKPLSGVPVVLIAPQQKIGDNEYVVWNYNPIALKTYLYATGVVSAGITLALYQLWPLWARQGSYYVSIGCLGLVGVLMGLTIVRLILFLMSVVVLPKGFWLFPNLYADVGFFQSFKPVWAWSGDKTLPPKPKLKKRKPKPVSADDTTNRVGAVPVGAIPRNQGAPTPGSMPMLVRQTPNGPVPVGPAVPNPNNPGQFMMHPLLKAILEVAAKRADARIGEIIRKEGPKTEEEMNVLRQTILKEEMARAQSELQSSELVQKAKLQAQQKN
nr:Sec62 [Starmerella bombicola]